MGLRHKKRAQVTLELVLAMIGVMIIFVGCIKTFIWLTDVMVFRQRIYDETRPKAASVPKSGLAQERQVEEDWLPRLETMSLRR